MTIKFNISVEASDEYYQSPKEVEDQIKETLKGSFIDIKKIKVIGL